MSQDKAKIVGYEDKLYDLLPAVYKYKDTAIGKQLESLIQIIAEQVAVLEKDIGGMYDNWFIETCDEWVTSYIADLIGARSLSTSKISSLSTTKAVSQRAYVANTLGYRRRKGTLAMLEQLARDITQWNAKTVEFFQLLDTAQNINHIRLDNHRTPSLKNMSKLDLLNSPFDTIAHTVEVRRIGSGRGYYNIQNIGIFLWRLEAFPSINTPAFKLDGKTFTFNPFGYTVPIFNLPETESLSSHLAEEVNVPAPIRRRALYDNLVKYYDSNGSIFLKVKYDGETKWQDVTAGDILVCNLSNSCTPENNKVAIDPELGKIKFSKYVKDVMVNYYYGFSGKIGGGFYDRLEYGFDSEKPAIYQISKKQAFVWNKIPGDAEECSHLREILRNDFSIAWVTESLAFTKISERTIKMSDGDNSLSISLGDGNMSAKLESGDVYAFFDAREDQDGTIYVLNNSVNVALNWWKKDRNPNTLLEIIDSEVYDENIEVNLPAGFTLTIRAEQGKRPIMLGSLKIQGEKDSNLILDGLWINNPANNPAVTINSGDMKSLTIRHCTMVPGNNPDDKKVGISVPAPLCTLNMITSKNDESKNLAKFLKSKLNLDWISENAVFKLKKDSNEKYFDKGYFVLNVGKNHAKINLTKSETPKSSAILSVNIDDGEWKKVYEFSVLTENDKKAMYLKDSNGNDNLEIILDHAISGRINMMGSDAELKITDSVIDGKDECAILCYSATIHNTTIFGKTVVDKLTLASNTIFTDVVEAKLTQQGCVRFSYVPPQSKTPRRYICLPKEISDDPKSEKIHPRFTSKNYGDPGYAQLHKNVDTEIFGGADNGAEMGAFNHLYQPQRLADLKSNLDEYLRFGLEAGIFLVT